MIPEDPDPTRIGLDELIALIEPVRALPARLECGEQALRVLRQYECEAPRSSLPPWVQSPLPIFGVQVYINPDLRPGEWKLYDDSGAVIKEGEIR